MTQRKAFWIAGLLTLATTTAARAEFADMEDLMRGASEGVVRLHEPFPTGGPGSDTEFFEPLSTLTAQRATDDFTLSADATIRRIAWWGFYGSTPTSPAEQPPPAAHVRSLVRGNGISSSWEGI